jgi:hypothetical protein
MSKRPTQVTQPAPSSPPRASGLHPLRPAVRAIKNPRHSYAVATGHASPGYELGSGLTSLHGNKLASELATTPVLPKSVRQVTQPEAKKERARWQRLGLRNKHVIDGVAAGKFLIGDPAYDGITKRRIEEMAYISRELPKFGKGKTHGPMFRQITQKLDNCSPRHLSGSMLSFLSRHVREQLDFKRVKAAFADVPSNHLFLETKLVTLIYGTIETLPGKVRREIAIDRQRNRNHICHFVETVPQYGTLMVYKVYEIECYRADDLKRAHELYQNGGLPDDEATAEGETWSEYLAWQQGRNPPRISRRKIETLFAMGWNPASEKDVWLLHSHALVRVQDVKQYYELQKAHLYPLDYQVLLTGLRSTKSRDENLRDIIRYLLKAAPRYGLLFSNRKREYYLAGVALKRFIALYDKLGYRGLKGHFGLPNCNEK